MISFFRIILVPVIVFFLVSGDFILALYTFIIASFTDVLDGWMARRLNQITEFGEFIDPLADKLLVISALIAIIAIDPAMDVFDIWMIFVIVGRDILITIMRWLAIKQNKPLKTSKFGKVKTAFQMISVLFIIMVYAAERGKIFETHPELPYWIMLAVTFFTALSGFRYLATNWRLFFPQSKFAIKVINKVKEILFTGFYSGYSPIAPGTAGSIVGMGILTAMYYIFGKHFYYANIALIVVSLYPAVWLGDSAENFYGTKDPKQVVLDEMQGMWITMIFVPFNWKTALMGFVLFRLFDILKPFPINKIEKLNGGLGIMADDWMAGIYACLCLHGIIKLAVHFDFIIC
jgi:CDP-diacylglycerol--glycerol-3-phosphate 3-phosphatidyltransferase